MVDTPWSMPWGRLWLGQVSFPVKRLDVREWVSSPFRAWVYVVLGDNGEAPDRAAVIGQPAYLEWGNGDWGRRCRGGVVTWLRAGDCAETERPYFELTIEPRIMQLAQGAATRLFTGVEHRELVTFLLRRAGYPAGAIDWRGDTLDRRRHLLQAEESDFALLQRVLARAGVCYAWGDGSDECIRFVENPRDFPLHQRSAALSPHPGAAAGGDGFDRHALVRQLPVPPAGLVAPKMLEDADRLRMVRRQRAAAATCRFRAAGPRADLAAGDRLKIEAQGEVNVPYLLLYTHHRLNVDRGGNRVPGGYQVSLEAVPEWDGDVELIYRPPEPDKAARPLAMSAEIVSRSARRPDAFKEGGARLRLAQDEQASRELPRIMTFNGHASSRSGWYTPLADGNRVLVSCLDHDPDAPVILGVLPTGANRQLAARSSGRDGSWLSAAGQGVTVTAAGITAPEETHLTLHSPGMDNCLQFQVSDARVHDLVRLASEKGLLDLECGGDLHERTGGARRDDVAGSDHLTVSERIAVTGDASACVRATQSVSLTGGRDVRVASGNALQLCAGKGVTLRGGADTRIRLTGGDGVWQTLSGDLRLQAAGAVRLTSHRGTITLTNASRSAGFAVGSDGGTTLWGKNVSLHASGGIAMEGDVDYNTGGPMPVEPVVVQPSECADLAKVAVDGVMDIEPTEW